MTKQKKITLTKTIIRYDKYLNFFLGFVFIFIPGRFSSLIAHAPLPFPTLFWIVLGIGFLVFALWQHSVFSGKPAKKDLLRACWAAWIPVVALTYALLFLDLPLYPIARYAIWGGNLYMLWLGQWYFDLSK